MTASAAPSRLATHSCSSRRNVSTAVSMFRRSCSASWSNWCASAWKMGVATEPESTSGTPFRPSFVPLRRSEKRSTHRYRIGFRLSVRDCRRTAGDTTGVGREISLQTHRQDTRPTPNSVFAGNHRTQCFSRYRAQSRSPGRTPTVAERRRMAANNRERRVTPLVPGSGHRQPPGWHDPSHAELP